MSKVLPIKPKALLIPKQRASKRAKFNFINKTHNSANDAIQVLFRDSLLSNFYF
jgi:hypothetical protein